MKLTFVGTGLLAFVILFAGCKPKEPGAGAATTKAGEVALVPVTERSRHFEAVNAQLELGGTLYGYVDIDGDILKVVPYLRTLGDTLAQQQSPAAPFLKQDFTQIITDLGLNDVRAVGFSSVPSAGGGFRNRVYLHTPDGRRGLLAGLGGAPTPFVNARLAPADADLYAETDVDAPALYAAIRSLIVRVAGEAQADVFESQLRLDKSGLGITPLALIETLKGRATVVLRTDKVRTVTLPGPKPFTMPYTQFLVRVDGLAAALEPALSGLPVFTASQEGLIRFYELKAALPIDGLQPVLAVENGALYVASDMEFLKASLGSTGGLAKTPAFMDALAELGDRGNGVTYVSPRFFDQLRRLKLLNPELPADTLKGMDFILASLPASPQPLVAVRINLPEGILYRARWHRSLKQDVAMIGVYNPVTVGLMAAMAIPAFQKVRMASQEKAIINNLRQLDAAAQQHMLETGVSAARYGQLVGSDKYIRSLTPVDGEDYTKLIIRSTDKEIVVVTKSGRAVRLKRW
ncbi:hypothetical protein [Rariglobus hedericola]|uniref:DUF3352 domain-containing protein n=1 Tax=Rariglobus hedericola TaxID=2597822 RepID=A0A556QRC3_9BACT|nr:hypothetical protein [Rariglobus hedericola]TSJ79184.1 hypothetical protein FPL22_07790 [Rariglobus hedericola]